MVLKGSRSYRGVSQAWEWEKGAEPFEKGIVFPKVHSGLRGLSYFTGRLWDQAQINVPSLAGRWHGHDLFCGNCLVSHYGSGQWWY